MDFYSVCTGFKSQSGYELSWMTFGVLFSLSSFLSLSIGVQYLETHYDWLLTDSTGH